MAEETQPCPDCGTLVPFDPRFSPWCECGWNLEPPDRSHEWNAPSGPGRIYRALAAARATKLFEAAQRGSPERPRWGLEGTLLLGASSLLVCGMLLPPVGGVLLLLEARESPILLVPAIFLLAVAVAFAPRPGRLEKESLTSKESHPRLHDLVRRVAAELKVDPPELIAISADLNAYVTRVGLRQRRALVVGLPLLALLDREERVALLGHEMAHLANGDLTRGGIVHLAIHTLTVWIYLLEQPRPLDGSGIGGYAAWLVMIGASLVPRAMLWVLIHLSYDRAQRAEYFADRLGASVAGTPAFVGLLERLLQRHILELAQQRVVHHTTDRSVVDELVHLVHDTPPRERERLRRVAQLELSALDTTHPPTAFRIRLLESHPVEGARIELDAEANAALDRELASAAARIDRELVDAFRARLYPLRR
ncbi:MAG TPA: M48 family metalloprotease [Planctomycetota bacterium]|nr:M48 family metalloprotease [Planctomycetota bacterium]